MKPISPCPCNRTPHEPGLEPRSQKTERGHWVVHCPQRDCDAETPAFRNEADAIKAWNGMVQPFGRAVG